MSSGEGPGRRERQKLLGPGGRAQLGPRLVVAEDGPLPEPPARHSPALRALWDFARGVGGAALPDPPSWPSEWMGTHWSSSRGPTGRVCERAASARRRRGC